MYWVPEKNAGHGYQLSEASCTLERGEEGGWRREGEKAFVRDLVQDGWNRRLWRGWGCGGAGLDRRGKNASMT